MQSGSGLEKFLISIFKLNFFFSLYVSAGGSDDYAIASAGIKYAFTFEIGEESLGFAVPTKNLRKTVEEGWIAIKAMTLQAIKM
jgi:hypothetical protein